MNKLIVANWKMNPKTEKEAISLAKAEDKRGVVIAPPFVFLSSLRDVLKKASLGAQDVFWENPRQGGVYTGEMSARMLKKSGVKYVIIGHSQRRSLGETDKMINKKVKTALETGLKVILCVGENLNIRCKGKKAVENFIQKQLKDDLAGIRNWKLVIRNLFIAYEPVWAISTNKGARADTKEDAAEMIKFIKKFLVLSLKLKVKVLYGGSVNSKNAKGFLEISDGLLVGGASLKSVEFLKILR